MAAPGACPSGWLLDGLGRCARWVAPLQVEAPDWFAYASVPLQDGRAMVVTDRSVDLFDLATGATTSAAPMQREVGWPFLVDLGDGTVLAAGGYTEDGRVEDAEVYLIGEDRWEPLEGRWPPGMVVRSTDGGQVLVVGDQACARFDVRQRRMHELRCPKQSRSYPGLEALPDGRILAVGGVLGEGEDAPVSAAVSLLDARHRRWRSRADSPIAWASPELVALPGPAVLAMSFRPDAEQAALYDVRRNRWTTLPVPESVRGVLHVEALPDGGAWGVSAGAVWAFDADALAFEVTSPLASRAFGTVPDGDGHAWVHTREGLQRLGPGEQAFNAPPDSIFARMVTAPTGEAVWVGDGEAHVSRDGRAWVREAVALPRAAAVVATDDAVVVLGGYRVDERGDSTPSPEVWVRRDGAWRRGVDMPSAEGRSAAPSTSTDLAAVALPSGQVLTSDGLRYDPVADRFGDAPELPREALLALSDGRVVALGIEAGWVLPADAHSTTLEGAVPVTLPSARESYATLVLPDDRVLLTGGMGRGSGTFHDDAWVLDPDSGTFEALPRMTQNRWDHVLLPLPESAVLAVGGAQHSAEVYDPVAGAWSATLTLPHEAQRPVGTVLPSGALVVVDEGVSQRFESQGARALPLELPPEAVSLGDPRAARWWRLEADARCALAELQPTSAACDPLDGDGLRPVEGPPRDAVRFPTRVNPVDASGAPVLRGWRDRCWVLEPEPTPVVCPAGMLQKAWDRCVFGEVFRGERFDCWCDGPLGGGAVDCPM